MQQIQNIDYKSLPPMTHIHLEIENNKKVNIKIDNQIYFTCDYYQFLFSSTEKTYYYYQNKDCILNELRKIKKKVIEENKSYRLTISEELNSLLLGTEKENV
jgi:hypothetical protein